jgi:hypothetical protein
VLKLLSTFIEQQFPCVMTRKGALPKDVVTLVK